MGVLGGVVARLCLGEPEACRFVPPRWSRMGARRWPRRVHGGTSLAPGAPPLTVGLSPSASDGDSDVDSELEDRVDGVKSWLSKNKGSSKALSDDGSLKSSR